MTIFVSSIIQKESVVNKKLKNPTDKFLQPKQLQGVFESFMTEKYPYHESKLERIHNCGSYITFYTNRGGDMHALKAGNFCKDRLCPICSYRLARRTAYELMELLAVTKVLHGYEFIFLTLTAPNITSKELAAEIDSFQEAWKRLSNNRTFKKICKGFIRKLEVTYNHQANTYHPHYHVLLAVNKSYFTSRDYINRDTWLDMWQKAKRDDSITQVDVRKANLENIKQIYELATYSAKLKDILENGQKVFEYFYDSLQRRRLITFNGCFKEIKSQLAAGEIDFSQIPELEQMKILLDCELAYQWQNDEYIQKELRELPEDERKEFYVFVNSLE